MNKPSNLWKLTNINNITIPVPINDEMEATSLDEISNRLPDGAYTTFRTYQHYYTLHLEDHFLRLEETARLADHPVLLNRNDIKSCLKQILEMNKEIPELRVRVSIDLEKEIGDLYVMVEPLTTPSTEDYLQGVDVITTVFHRNNPKAKLTHFIKSAGQIKREIPKNINEALMLEENGLVLEGLSSNFFSIKNGEIWTEDEGVLSGITRSIVLEVADHLNIPVNKQGINISEINQISEAFITSTSRLVLPIKQIDQTRIGSVVPGLYTQKNNGSF